MRREDGFAGRLPWSFKEKNMKHVLPAHTENRRTIMLKSRTATPSRIALIAFTAMLAAAASAAPPKLGTVYTKANGSPTSPDLYTVIVEMDVPSGRYAISASGGVQNFYQNVDSVSCNLFVGESYVGVSNATVPSGAQGALAFDGTAVVTSDNPTIKIQCISSNSNAIGPWTSARLVAQLVPAIVEVP